MRSYSAQMVIIWVAETEILADTIKQAEEKAKEAFDDDDTYYTGGAIRVEGIKVREKSADELLHTMEYYGE